MHFKVNLKMKKPTCCCFTWTVFIELNFTDAYMLIRKTWDDRFAVKVGDRGFQELEGILVSGGGGGGEGLIPLYGLCYAKYSKIFHKTEIMQDYITLNSFLKNRQNAKDQNLKL